MGLRAAAFIAAGVVRLAFWKFLLADGIAIGYGVLSTSPSRISSAHTCTPSWPRCIGWRDGSCSPGSRPPRPPSTSCCAGGAARVAAASADARALYRSRHVDHSSARVIPGRTWVARFRSGSGPRKTGRASGCITRGRRRSPTPSSSPSSSAPACRAVGHGRGARDPGAARLAVRGRRSRGGGAGACPRRRARARDPARRRLRDHATAPVAQWDEPRGALEPGAGLRAVRAADGGPQEGGVPRGAARLPERALARRGHLGGHIVGKPGAPARGLQASHPRVRRGPSSCCTIIRAGIPASDDCAAR